MPGEGAGAMTVRVVADSSCDLPEPIRAELGVTVVPVGLTFGAETLRDGVDITAEGALSRVVAGEMPRFSQPPPGDFLAAYRAVGYDPWTGDPYPGLSIVSIHVTARLSGTANSALLAAGMLPGLDITVIDSRTGSMGTGFIVWNAAAAAKVGAERDEVLAIVDKAVKDATFFLVVPDLMHLHRSGRLGRAEAWLGHTLGLTPVICVRAGVVAPYRLMRGRPQGLKACITAALSRYGRETPVDVAAVHVAAEDDARYLLDQAKEAFTLRNALVVHAGGTVSAALGPGTAGLCVSRVPA